MSKKLLLIAGATTALVLGTAGEASAQMIISSPGAHENKVEIEPHLTWAGYYGGLGVGLRVGIPLIPNGPVQTINNSLALSLGGDFFFYSYGRGGYFGAAALTIPVMLQWNFYLHGVFSLFVEGGVAADFYFYHRGVGCGDFDYGCSFGIWPGLALGGRVHFNGRAGYPALTFRFGFPASSIGISF